MHVPGAAHGADAPGARIRVCHVRDRRHDHGGCAGYIHEGMEVVGVTKRWKVTWEIDVEGQGSPGEAAFAAWKIMQDPTSAATVLDVQEYGRSIVRQVSLGTLSDLAIPMSYERFCHSSMSDQMRVEVMLGDD